MRRKFVGPDAEVCIAGIQGEKYLEHRKIDGSIGSTLFFMHSKLPVSIKLHVFTDIRPGVFNTGFID